ncbi:hypothetical protein [Nonomuraea sp. CA-141351]|uniref:hypothetical protein n=1 Tax=Nonomuraea sp. CA-141351 TaxID=3239996 RepID=UPI003D91368B
MTSKDATAVRVRAAEADIAIVGSSTVTDWARRYFTPSWTVETVPIDEAFRGPQLTTINDPGTYAELAEKITRLPHTEITYARKPMLVTHVLEGIVAVSPDERLAFKSLPEVDLLDITTGKSSSEGLATAAARLAREMIRGQLIRAGWSLLHASAISRKGRVVLVFGHKGSGKTTLALTLTRGGEWDLVANDRVFVRVEDDRVRVLPWPSAAAVGLGLLDALGWYDHIRDRLAGGEELHPTQHQRVSDALTQGLRTPLWDGNKELKAQIWPIQFTHWFGIDLAQEGDAAALLFPHVDPTAAQPYKAAATRSLSRDDFMAGATEDRYPDVFELVRAPIGGSDTSRSDAAARLQALPHHSVVLTHDVAANAKVLDAVLADVS